VFFLLAREKKCGDPKGVGKCEKHHQVQIGKKKKHERVELYDETYERKQKRQKELSWFQSFIALKRDTELHSIRVCRD
jgi:hypothetical protein